MALRHTSQPFNLPQPAVELVPTRENALAGTVRARILALDPALPVASVQTMDEVVSRSAAVPRFNALLVTLVSALALLLAAIGVGGAPEGRSSPRELCRKTHGLLS